MRGRDHGCHFRVVYSKLKYNTNAYVRTVYAAVTSALKGVVHQLQDQLLVGSYRFAVSFTPVPELGDNRHFRFIKTYCSLKYRID
jgi:hypothetical protein